VGHNGGVTHDWAMFGRIALAALLCALVGFEREVRGKPSGDRTFALVGIGTAAFTVIGIDAFPSTAEKMLAGIVTGIGFIGAGLVMYSQETRHYSLTTASAIWSMAAVGILAGAGRVMVATLVTVLVLLILEIRHIPLLRVLDARRYVDMFPDDETMLPRRK
jgi:putative Mg2+ transporter-C (MgtC) family protein